MRGESRHCLRSAVSIRGEARLLAAVALTALVAACAPGQTGPSVRQGGTLYVAIDSDPASLNPLVASDSVSRQAYAPLFPLLYATNADLSVGPDLASALPVFSDGGKTLTVTLRPDAKWSDGMPITADDVVFTVNTERDPAIAAHSSFTWSPLTKVEAVDKSTVRFTLASPHAAFAATSLVTPIVPQHAFAGLNAAQIAGSTFNAGPTVSGGPYKFGHRVAGEAVYLDANPNYFLGNPHIDHVVEVVTKDRAKVLDQLEGDKLSWVPRLDAADAGNAASAPGVSVSAYPATSLDAVVFNVRPGHLFAEQPVRKALAFSVDHDTLVAQATMNAVGYPVWGDINPKSWAYNQSATAQYAVDANHARALLRGGGWQVPGSGVATRAGHPLAADLIYPSSDATRASAASLISSQTKAAGFGLTPRAMDDAAFGRALTSGSFEAAVVSLPTNLDPDNSQFLATGGAENYGGYSNAALDALAAGELAAVPSDTQNVQQVRKPIFDRIEQAVSADLPLYFLWVPRSFTAFSATVSGVAGAGAQLVDDRADSFYRDWFLL